MSYIVDGRGKTGGQVEGWDIYQGRVDRLDEKRKREVWRCGRRSSSTPANYRYLVLFLSLSHRSIKRLPSYKTYPYLPSQKFSSLHATILNV